MSELTPHQKIVLATYNELGEKQATADELGISRSSVRSCLDLIAKKQSEPEGSRVLVIGDTHAPCVHKDYIQFLKKIEKKHQCNRVVHIGDIVDWNSISFHEDSEAFMPNPG